MKKILIVEDEKLIADLLQKKLTDKGYYAFIANDGEKGLEEIKSKHPDLVLLDIILPRLNGFEILEAMRKDNEVKDIPVVIISNSGQPLEIDKARELGVKSWLVKTEFDPEEVIEKVEEQIGKGDEVNNKEQASP